MIRLLAIAIFTLSSWPIFAAEPEDLIKKVCSTGVPWTLPKVEAPFSVSEVYLNLNGPEDVTMRICHCTEKIEGSTFYVWVNAQKNAAKALKTADLNSLAGAFNGGSTIVSLLKGRGCLDARGKNIIVRHSDAENGRWGVYTRPPM